MKLIPLFGLSYNFQMLDLLTSTCLFIIIISILLGHHLKALRLTHGQTSEHAKRCATSYSSFMSIKNFFIINQSCKYHSFIHTEHLYSASSRELLRGAGSGQGWRPRGDGPPKKFQVGDGPCIRPPNI